MKIKYLTACAIAALAFGAGAARASDILTYTGNPFGNVFDEGKFDGTYVSVSMTLPIYAKYSGIVSYVTGDLPGLTASDVGLDTITPATTTSYSVSLELANGLPVDWDIVVFSSDAKIQTFNEDPAFAGGLYPRAGDTVNLGAAFVESYNYPDSVSGSWTAVAGAPEPGTWALTLLGVAGVGGALRRRRAGFAVV